MLGRGLERSYNRVKGRQPHGDPDRRRARLRSLTPGVGMRALREEELQPEQTVRHLLDALAHWLHAVPFRVVDDAPPFRDLLIIGMGEPDMPFGEEPFDQLASFRTPRTGDGPLAVRRRRLGQHRRLTAVSRLRFVGIAAMTEVNRPASVTSTRAAPPPLSTVKSPRSRRARAERHSPGAQAPGSSPAASRSSSAHCRSFGAGRRSTASSPHRTGAPCIDPEERLLAAGVPLGLTAASSRASPVLDASPILVSVKVLELPKSRLTPHQNERQMSVTSVISASRYRL